MQPRVPFVSASSFSHARSFRVAVFEQLESRRLLSAGAPDSSFGFEGVESLPVEGEVTSIAAAPDGRYYAVSSGANLVFRLNANGSIDTSFGNQGVVKLDRYPEDMLVQSDGKLLLTGAKLKPDFSGEVFVSRFTTAGSLDKKFGGGDGEFIYDVPNTGSGARTFELRAGKLTVGTLLGPDASPVLFRLHDDGTIDRRFNGSGHATVRRGTHASIIEDLVVLGDGSTVSLLAGNGEVYTALSKTTPGGHVDRSFGVKGSTPEIEFAGFKLFPTINGGFQVAGVSGAPGTGGHDFTLTAQLFQYTSRGKLDTNFGASGAATIAIPDIRQLTTVAQQPDGKLLLVGSAFDSPTSPFYHGFIARALPNGALDPSFGQQGIYDYGETIGDAYDASVTSDGKLVLAGADRNVSRVLLTDPGARASAIASARQINVSTASRFDDLFSEAPIV